MNPKQKILARNVFLSLPPIFLFPNLIGALLTVSTFTVLLYGLPELERRQLEQARRIAPDAICEFIELFSLCSYAGLTALDSFRLICDCFDEALGAAINRLLSRCDVGMSLTKSLQQLASEFPELELVVKILVRAQKSGARTTESLEIVLHLHRTQIHSDLLQRVRALSVKCVLPLGLCFLPAFVLLTIVPIIGCLIPSINVFIR